MTEKSEDSQICPAADPGHLAITQFLLPLLKAETVEAADRYRKRFEVELGWGPTDLTRRYMTQLPAEQQQQLLNANPRAYFVSMPKFYQAYVRGRCEQEAQQGTLDNMHDCWVMLFTSGGMTIRGEEHERDKGPGRRR